MIRSVLLVVTVVGAVLGRPDVHSHASVHHGGHAVAHHGAHAVSHHGAHAVTHHGVHGALHHGVHGALHHGVHAVPHHPILHHPIPHHGGLYHHDHYAPAHYNFDYAVHDDYSGNHFGHTESRDGYDTKGSYFVHLPDGRVQTVSYYADQYGYHPTVTYSGTAHHPAQYAPAKPYHK